MTSQSENDLLTNVAFGTPMGALMPQYWLPACLSSELRTDGDPLRLMVLPNSTDWFGRWRPAANQGNDYLIDREAQRTVSYSGIAEVFTQDSAVTAAISDRTLEHRVPSDRMITLTRRRLLDAVRALRDHGTVPPLVDNPQAGTIARSGDLIAPEQQQWLDAYEQTLAEALHPGFAEAAESGDG